MCGKKSFSIVNFSYSVFFIKGAINGFFPWFLLVFRVIIASFVLQ